jgi:dimethylargininase
VHFTHALVRAPAARFAAGLTTAGLGPPDVALARRQHEGYCRMLERLGLELIRLSADDNFPDSTFVEDTALVTRRGAILTRPGAPSRSGEVDAVRAAIRPWVPEPDEISSPGTVDGGDVCEAGSHYFIGISARTNPEGAGQLADWLARRGLGSRMVDIRGLPGLLHLKSGLAWLGDRRLLATSDLAGHEALAGWEVVCVPSGDEYAANAIRVGGTVLIPEGFAATTALLRCLGYEVAALPMSEFRKMDGGLSCLSVRW